MDALVITIVLMCIVNIALYLQLKQVRAKLQELEEIDKYERNIVRNFRVTL